MDKQICLYIYLYIYMSKGKTKQLTNPKQSYSV